MHDKVSLVPGHDNFLNKFLGPRARPQSRKKPFGSLKTPKVEEDMYKSITSALNTSELCPEYVFVSHSHQSGNGHSGMRAVDLGMYHRTSSPPGLQAADVHVGVEWSFLEIPMPCKPDEDRDAFPSDSFCDEPTTDEQKKTFEQLMTYAEAVFRYQHRTFFFMVLLLGDCARILRIDRSSIFYTERFNYKTQSWKLCDFFIRYAELSREGQGWDSTAERVEPDSPLYQAMLDASKQKTTDQRKSPEKEASRQKNTEEESTEDDDYVRDMFRASLDEKWPWWKLKVPFTAASRDRRSRSPDVTDRHSDPHDIGPDYKTFLVGKPHFCAPGVAGRGTRGYIALPVEGEKVGDRFYYLKDAWRVDLPDIQQEGAILSELNKGEVPYVPTLYTHGDISGEAQLTNWRAYWAKLHPKAKKNGCPLKRHHHYRLVVEEVGKPLHEFGDCSIGLLSALICCLYAHQAAFAMGIIHRDISAGNIILWRDPKAKKWWGILNDWELSEKFKSNVTLAKRQPDRTGTWQYMSVHALNNADWEISLEDELESCFHVLLYIAVRFIESNLRVENVGHFLSHYFDGFSDNGLEFTCGAQKFAAMRYGEINLSCYKRAKDARNATLRFLWPKKASKTPTAGSKEVENEVSAGQDHPLTSIINELLTWFKALYAQDSDNTVQTIPKATDKQKNKASAGTTRGMRFGRPTRKGGMKHSSSAFQGPSVPKVSQEEQARNEALRKKLASHDAFIELLSRIYDEDICWPENDRVEDRKPKDGYGPKQGPSAGGTLNGSMKRRRHAEAEDSPAANKRSRQ